MHLLFTTVQINITTVEIQPHSHSLQNDILLITRIAVILHAGGSALLVVVRLNIIKFQLRILVPRSKY